MRRKQEVCLQFFKEENLFFIISNPRIPYSQEATKKKEAEAAAKLAGGGGGGGGTAGQPVKTKT